MTTNPRDRDDKKPGDKQRDDNNRERNEPSKRDTGRNRGK
jgi:hypothetical protein